MDQPHDYPGRASWQVEPNASIPLGTVRVFGQKFAFEDAIEYHTFAPLESLACVWPMAFISGVHFLFLTGSHCKLRPNTEGEDGGAAFWDSLFKEQAAVGLRVFKLDHTQQQVPDMAAMQQTVGAVDVWLSTMAASAAKHGVVKFYGGCVPSMILHSVTLPSAVVGRAGDDYYPSGSRAPHACRELQSTATPSNSSATNGTAPTAITNAAPTGTTHAKDTGEGVSIELGSALTSASIGRNTLLWWALGIRPYKDATFTAPQTWSGTTCFQGTVRVFRQRFTLEDAIGSPKHVRLKRACV
jgi:hypothetical protein